jgi:hypothetical protein
MPAFEGAWTHRGEDVSFMLICGRVVPEWERRNHFRTEVGQKRGFEKQFESGAG